MGRKQILIKSKDRVRDVGEVFTPDFLVEQMLDQFPADAWEKNKNWLEPTCGNGQFILGVLRRKLAHGAKLLQALDTTFGCDVMADNVSECHIRIYNHIVLPYARSRKFRGWENLRWKVVCIVENNIRLTKDSLQEDFTKWQWFTTTPKDNQVAMENKVKSIIDMIEGEVDLDLQSPLDKRLFEELSILTRN